MQANNEAHSRNMHVYTFEAKNTPNPITAQKLSQKVGGKHPFWRAATVGNKKSGPCADGGSSGCGNGCTSYSGRS
jgi:hypothetical protein